MNERSALVLTSDPFLREVVDETLPVLSLQAFNEKSTGFPCLVIADAEYPDHVAVESWLNRTGSPPWVPVILISGPRACAAAAARQGASAVLSKPVDSRKMKAVIDLLTFNLNEGDETHFEDAGPAFDPPADLNAAAVPVLVLPSTADTAKTIFEDVDRLLAKALAELGLVVGGGQERSCPAAKNGAAELKKGGPPSAPESVVEERPSRSSDPPPFKVEPRLVPRHPQPEVHGKFIHPPEPFPDDERLPKRRIPRALAALATILMISAGAWYWTLGKRPSWSGKSRLNPVGETVVPVVDPQPSAPKIETAMETIPNATQERFAPGADRTVPSASSPSPAESVKSDAPIAAPSGLERSTETVPGEVLSPPEMAKGAFPVAAKSETKETPGPANREKAAVPPRAVPADSPPAPPRTPARAGAGPAAVGTQPVPIHTPAPAYPSQAYEKRVEGRVTLAVLVSETGRVLESRLVGSTSMGMGFEKAAIKAVGQWTFFPARKDGVEVKAWSPVVVEFRIR